jgi:hypothetical protein
MPSLAFLAVAVGQIAGERRVRHHVARAREARTTARSVEKDS